MYKMKKILFLLATILTLSINLNAQGIGTGKYYDYVLLYNWTFDTDTSIYVGTKYNYEWGLQFETASLTGTANGTVEVLHKMSGFTNYTRYSTSYVDTINAATYSHSFTGNQLTHDSLKIDIKKVGITGGTMNLKLRLLRK